MDRSARQDEAGAGLIAEDAPRVHSKRDGGPRAVPLDAGEWLDVCCPYLRSADGTWRSVVPQRGQRCWGQTPPAPLEPVTQERLCRTGAHTSCEIFVAAEARRSDALARDHLSSERLDGRFGVLVRPAPLVLDGPVHRVPINADRRTRVAAALAAAGGVVLVAFLAGLGGGGPQPTQQPPPIAFVTPSPAPGVSQGPGPTTPPGPSTSPAITPLPSEPVTTPAPPTPTAVPGPSATPRIARTYRVHRGDTLAKIAARFGVTKKQILAVNDLGDPPTLLYGTFINIPFP